MIIIKQIVKIALVFFVLVVFSGCTESVQYISVPCKVKKPVRTAPIYSCSAKYPNDDFLYSKCVAEKGTLLEGDYQTLGAAFDACLK